MARTVARPNPNDAELDAALERGREEIAQHGARAVRYDADTDEVAITVKSGATVAIPRALIPGLEKARPQQLADVHLSPSRTTIMFDELDEDYAVRGLIRRVLGLNEQQRTAGAVTSPAKRAAAAKNGARGGRPRKDVIPTGGTTKPKRRASATR